MSSDIGSPNMTDPKPARVIWWEPRWSYVPRESREFQSAFPLRSWLRIAAASAAGTILVAVATEAFIPGLQFAWTRALVISIAAMVGVLFAFFVLILTIPPLVFVTANGIGCWWPPLLHEGVWYFKRSELKAVTLTVRDHGKHSIRFRTKRVCKQVGLARHVRLDQLLVLLSDSLVVRDRRRRPATVNRESHCEH